MGGAIHDQALAGLPQDVQDGLRSLRLRTNVLFILSVISLVYAIVFVFYAKGFYGLDAMQDKGYMGPAFWGGGIEHDPGEYLQWLITIYILFMAIYVIFYGIWLYRAHSNLMFLGADNIKNSSGDAVLWSFVPWISSVMTWKVAREVWRGSDPGAPPRFKIENRGSGWFAKTWYLTFFVAGISFSIVTIVVMHRLPSWNMSYAARQAAPLEQFFVMIVAAAAIGLINVLFSVVAARMVSARQQRRAAVLLSREPNVPWQGRHDAHRGDIFTKFVVNKWDQLFKVGSVWIALTALQFLLVIGAEDSSDMRTVKACLTALGMLNLILRDSALYGILFYMVIMWIYDAYLNLTRFDIAGLEHTPVQALTWWAIPVFNVFGYILLLDELWKGSIAGLTQSGRIDDYETSRLVTIAKTAWAGIILYFIVLLGMDCYFERWAGYLRYLYMKYGAVVIIPVAALVLIIARRITARQKQRSDLLDKGLLALAGR